MGKKKTLKLSSLLLLKNTEIIKSSSSFWPSCHQPKTLSFRANNKDNNTFKTINSAYLDLDTTMDMLETSESFFTVSPDNSVSFSTTSEEESRKLDSIETVIRGLRSDRLFFEPDETNSILQTNKSSSSSSAAVAVAAGAVSEDGNETLVFKDSVVLSMESQDPYIDFRKSMEEMVAAHDVKDWECLQELLCWYLKVNEKSNHGYIVGAFVDLLVGLAFASTNSSSSFSSSYSSSTSLSPSSPLSFYSSSLSSSCLEVEEEVVQTLPSSSLLLEQVSEEIDHQDEPGSSSRASST